VYVQEYILSDLASSLLVGMKLKLMFVVHGL